MAGARMEETSQQEKTQKAENKTQNEEEGGIRWRLRDRELLRRRKAEAEEKETNQWVFGVESQRKRSRGENKSGAKRRGRPRKTDPVLQFPVLQEEAAPADVISALGSVGLQRPPDLDAPAPGPVPDLVQNSVFGKLDVGSAPVPVQDSAQVVQVPVKAPYVALEPVRASYAAPVPVKAPYVVQVPAPVPDDDPIEVQAPEDCPDDDDDDPYDDPGEVQAPDDVAIRAPSQDPVPAAAPAPPRVEILYTESPGRETLDQVLIEDLGPDDEDDVSPSQNDGADEDETPLMNTAEQNKMYSVPLPQEYLPGNPL
ncbi:uncharacterized protein hemgn [Anableps anableps]